MLKTEILRRVPSFIVILLSILFIAYYITFTYSEYFITIFLTFLIDGILFYMVTKMIPFETSESTKSKYIMIALLFCFSFTAVSLSMIFQNVVTPANSDDPYISTKSLLVDTYYTGTSKEWEYTLKFNADETITVEELVFNTTISARQVEISCLNSSEITCFYNSVHSWKNTSAVVNIDCRVLPCNIFFKELKNDG